MRFNVYTHSRADFLVIQLFPLSSRVRVFINGLINEDVNIQDARA